VIIFCRKESLDSNRFDGFRLPNTVTNQVMQGTTPAPLQVMALWKVCSILTTASTPLIAVIPTALPSRREVQLMMNLSVLQRALSSASPFNSMTWSHVGQSPCHDSPTSGEQGQSNLPGLKLVAFLFVLHEILTQGVESSVDFGIVRMKEVLEHLPDALNKLNNGKIVDPVSSCLAYCEL
jgi:hypothetical protein